MSFFISFGIDFKLMFWGFVVRFFVDGIDIYKLLGRFRRLPVCRFRELPSRVGAGVPLCFSSSSRDSGVAFMDVILLSRGEEDRRGSSDSDSREGGSWEWRGQGAPESVGWFVNVGFICGEA